MRQQFREEENQQSAYRAPVTAPAITTMQTVTVAKPKVFARRAVAPVRVKPEQRQATQEQQSKKQKRELPRMRFVVLALAGIFLVPWFPTKTNAPAPRIPHESANRLYAKSQKHFIALRGAVPGQSWQGKRLSQFTPADKKAWKEWTQRKPTGHLLPKGMEDANGLQTIEEARRDLALCRSELATIPQVLKLPFYASMRDEGPLQVNYIGVRELARLSARDGNLKQIDGDFSGALTAYLNAYAIGHQMYQGQTLVAGMIGVLCEGIGLANAEPTVSHLTAGQAREAALRLESMLANRPTFAQILAREQGGTSEMMRFYAYPQAQQELWGKIPLVHMANDLFIQRYQSIMQQNIEKAQRPYQEIKGITDPELSNFDAVAIPIPNTRRALMSYNYRTNKAHQLLLELALQGYKAEHQGKFPAALAELVTAGYLKAIPTDLYSTTGAESFHYDPITGKLWSVGANGLDEHGEGDDAMKELPTG